MLYLFLAYLTYYLIKKNLWLLSLFLTGLVVLSLNYTVTVTLMRGISEYWQVNLTALDSETTRPAQDYMDRSAKADWRIAELQKLTIGAERLEDILATKGKANEATVQDNSYVLTYDSTTPGYVRLNFEEDDQGHLILSRLSAVLPADNIKTDLKHSSPLEQTAYDNWSIGDWNTGENGSLLTDVLAVAPVPALASYSFNNETQTLMLTYIHHPKTSEHQLHGAVLTFLTTDKGKTFKLIDKTTLDRPND